MAGDSQVSEYYIIISFSFLAFPDCKMFPF